MFVAGLRAIAILKDRASWSVIWRSLCVTLAVLIALCALVWWGLSRISLFETVWIDRIIDVLGGLAFLLLTWMLFPAVVTLVMTIFLERILRWVEARHYPDLPAPRSPAPHGRPGHLRQADRDDRHPSTAHRAALFFPGRGRSVVLSRERHPAGT